MKIFFSKKGFTLLELLVVLTIFSIMTALLVANQRKFGANINLSDITYDVALSLREAQTYGLAFKDTGGNDFTSSYGMHFDKTDLTGYSLFADKRSDPNDPGSVDHTYGGPESIDGPVKFTYQIGSGIAFSRFCVKNRDTLDISCSSGTTAPLVFNKLDITFTRPNPDATIVPDGDTLNTYSEATLCLVSNIDSKRKKISVLASGQIAIEDVIAGDTTDLCN